MRGPCACPGGSATNMPHGTQANRVATRTSTRPPPFPASAPCPYRMAAAFLVITLFGCQKLLGTRFIASRWANSAVSGRDESRPYIVRLEKDTIEMQGFNYLVVAYIIAWVGLFAYLAFVMLRIRGVRTELVAIEELVREQREQQKKE